MEQLPNDTTPPGRFELSLRVLGNEFIGVRLEVDDLKQKWVLISTLAIVGIGYTAATYGPALVGMFK